ncbi:MAG TPA: hypothetical protein PKJ19_12395 [Flavobacteriales bacterium]|nr:hypothetical protein [Flavobacteriales bacterium]HNU57685.1 hypothetical protein [Flavobacteriales bacterium]
MTQAEFEVLINDATKRIDGDITWREDEDKSPAVEFMMEVSTANGDPLRVYGNYRGILGRLSYVLLHSNYGRIYALDLGQDHRNPDGKLVGEKHKHRWTEQYLDKEAYVPEDITAPPTDPVTVWDQFCIEANITHNGRMLAPPAVQFELL